MKALMWFWTRIGRFAKATEGIDDPGGQYMVALEKRIDKLERAVEAVERRLREPAEGGTK